MAATGTFASLKSARGSSLQNLAQEMSKMTKKAASDDRFWKLTTDKTKCGSAIIRFLPAPEGETVPFVRLWHHAFKGSGGWYFENSLTTIGQPDPVSELNSKLWQEGPNGQKLARDQKRKLKYIANIYVVKDSANPSAEGKVFTFAFGKKVFDMLNEKMTPQFEDQAPMNPFDLWSGANLKLRLFCDSAPGSIPNYDKSEFDIPAPLDKSDEKMEAIWKQAFPLQPFIAADQFKSYEELQDRLEKVLAIPSRRAPAASAPEPKVASSDRHTTVGVAQASPIASSTLTPANQSFFESLANEDDE